MDNIKQRSPDGKYMMYGRTKIKFLGEKIILTELSSNKGISIANNIDAIIKRTIKDLKIKDIAQHSFIEHYPANVGIRTISSFQYLVLTQDAEKKYKCERWENISTDLETFLNDHF